MGLNVSQMVEDIILGKLVGVLLDNGHRVVISDQDGGGLHVYSVPDNGEPPKDDGKYDYWVRCVPGNGSDFVSDYSINLENIIKPVNDFCKLID